MVGTVRILQIIATSRASHGGPSAGAIALNAALTAGGAEAFLLCAAYEMGPDGRLIPDSPKSPRPTVLEYSPSRPFALMSSLSLFKAIWSMTPTADLIHIHGQYLAPNVMAYVAARRFGKPHGVQAHGTMEPYQRERSRWKKLVFDTLIGRRLIRTARYVLFASASEAERALDLVPSDQALVHPLGASLVTVAEQEPLDMALPRREKVVLYLGRLAAKKRPDMLIEAWSRVQNAESVLVIAGPEEDYTVADLERAARSAGVSESVRIVGAVDAYQKAWLYRASGTFALPSENENFGLSVAEAMVAGCHVVTTDQVATSDHLRLANSGTVFKVGDFEALVSALRSAMDNENMIRESGELARRYAESTFSWPALADVIVAQAKSR